MARRNQGPPTELAPQRLRTYTSAGTKRGRYSERTTGTKDREEAEIVFAEWMQSRRQASGPSDPAKALVTAILNTYAANHGPRCRGRETLANNITHLASLFEGKSVAEVPDTSNLCREARRCRWHRKARIGGAPISDQLRIQKSGHHPASFLRPPDRVPTKDRWLTEDEAQRLLDASTFDPDARRTTSPFHSDCP